MAKLRADALCSHQAHHIQLHSLAPCRQQLLRLHRQHHILSTPPCVLLLRSWVGKYRRMSRVIWITCGQQSARCRNEAPETRLHGSVKGVAPAIRNVEAFGYPRSELRRSPVFFRAEVSWKPRNSTPAATGQLPPPQRSQSGCWPTHASPRCSNLATLVWVCAAASGLTALGAGSSAPVRNRCASAPCAA